MAFLSLLAIAVGILSAMGLVVVGLVEAPWQVLLTGLLAALYGLQRVVNGGGEAQLLGMPMRSPPSSQVVKHNAPEAAEVQAPATLPTAAVNPPAETATAADTYELTYRGIRYQVKKAPPASEAESGDADQLAQPKPAEGTYRGQRWRQ